MPIQSWRGEHFGIVVRCLADALRKQETLLCDMPKDVHFSSTLPFSKVAEGRLYNSVTFDQPSQSYVASAVFAAPFEIFDEDGTPANRLYGEDLQEPESERSALELIEPGSWRTIDG